MTLGEQHFSPVESVITGQPYRRLCRWCRDGRIVGAVKIGRRWFVTESSATASNDLMTEELRRLGYAA